MMEQECKSQIPDKEKVQEFMLDGMLQDLQPDTQRLEIEEVARVIVTPRGVEVYTFNDKIFLIEFGGTIVKKMNWVNTPEGGAVLEEDERETRQLNSNTARQQASNYNKLSKKPFPETAFIPV